MPFSPKHWEDEPHPLEVLEGKRAATSTTPVDAAALIDHEERLATYVDQSKPFIDARDFVGHTPSTADKGPQLQAALTAAAEEGPGAKLLLPPWEIVTAQTLNFDSGVVIDGHGPLASGIKLGDGSNVDLLASKNFATDFIYEFALRNFHLDGNAAKNTAGSCLKVNGISFLLDWLYIHDAPEDGLVQRGPTLAVEGQRAYGESEPFMQNCKVWDSGRYGIDWNLHDSHWLNVLSISNETRNFLVNEEAFALKATQCHSFGAADYGWEFKASANCVNCEAEGGRNANVLLGSSLVKWIGGEVFYDPGTGGKKVGFEFATGTAFNCRIDTKVKGCTEGAFKFTGTGGNSEVRGMVEAESGTAVVGSPSETVLFDLKVIGGATPGITASERIPAAKNASSEEDGSVLVADSTKPGGAAWTDRSGGRYHGPPVVVGTPASAAAPAEWAYEYVKVTIPNRVRLTGIAYRVGATKESNVRVGIYSSSGAKLAGSNSAAQAAINTFQKVPFATSVLVEAGDYFLLIQYAKATATCMKARQLTPSGTATGTSFSELPPSITAPTEPENVDRPLLVTY